MKQSFLCRVTLPAFARLGTKRWYAAPVLACLLGAAVPAFAQSERPISRETANKQANTEGSFGGIGAELETNSGVLRVKRVVTSSPAERASLKAGWEIPRINGISTAGMELKDAVKLVRGTIGTELKLEVRLPDGTSRQISLIREQVLAVAKTEGPSESFRLLAMTDKVGLLSQDPKQREATTKTVGQTAEPQEIVFLLKQINGGKGEFCHGMYFLMTAWAAGECGAKHAKDTTAVRALYDALLAGVDGAAVKVFPSPILAYRTNLPPAEVVKKQNFLTTKGIAKALQQMAAAGALHPFNDAVVKDLTALTKQPWADPDSKQALASVISAVLTYAPKTPDEKLLRDQ